MMRIEARFNYYAAASRQPYLNRLAEGHGHRSLNSGNLHCNELRYLRFANPFLPLIKLPIAKSAITAERRYTLPTCSLLGNQCLPSPLFRSLASHPSTVRHLHTPHKMGST